MQQISRLTAIGRWNGLRLRGQNRAYKLAKHLAGKLGYPVYRPEEEWLEDFANGRPDVFFLQIGANDGKTDDRLYQLVRGRGWRGVLLEPVKHLFDRLVSNYAGSQGLIFENSALGEKDGKAAFYHLRQTGDSIPHWYDQLGSFRREVVLSHGQAIPDIQNYLVEESVDCISFGSLVMRHNIERIDLILIDTEGYDLEILRTIDLDRFQPALIIYEQKHLSSADKARAVALLRGHGYKVYPCGPDNVAVQSRRRPSDAPRLLSRP